MNLTPTSSGVLLDYATKYVPKKGAPPPTYATVYVSLGDQELAEYALDAVASSPSQKFVYGTYVDEPVVAIAPDGSNEGLAYYHRNNWKRAV